MKRLFKLTLPALLAMITLGLSAPAAAQSTVLVVDTQQVWAETELGSDIARQLQELAENLQARITQGGQELQAELEDLQRQRDEFIITDEVFEQRIGELQQQDQALRAGIEVSGQAMQLAQRRAQTAFFQAILEDLSAEMEERSGTVLLERSNTLLISSENDISDDVVVRVNGRITSLEVELLPPPPTETPE